MTVCVIKVCRNYIGRSKTTKKVSYHRIPSDPILSSRWIDIIRKSRGEELWKPTKNSVVCSDHFHRKDIYFVNKSVSGRLRLQKGTVPRKALFLSSLQSDGSDVSDEEADTYGCEDEKNTFKETELIINVEAGPSGVIRDARYMSSVERDDTSNVANTISHCEDSKNTKGSPLSENEIKVFCPKCDTEVSHTAEGIQEDQTKILIAKVYHYFEREYEELKTIYGDLDLTPLSKFRQRTALATGVSETTVLQILKEEEGRNADKRQEPPEKRRARKRSRQTESSSEEDSSDDNAEDNEQSSNEAQTVVVKIEPPEYYNEESEIYVPAAVKVEPSDIELNTEQAQTDPISLHVKTEPRSDVVDDTNETFALNEPAGTNRKGRKIPRSDVIPTWQQTRGDSSTAATASSVRLTEEVDESSLFGDTEIKVEEIEIPT